MARLQGELNDLPGAVGAVPVGNVEGITRVQMGVDQSERPVGRIEPQAGEALPANEVDVGDTLRCPADRERFDVDLISGPTEDAEGSLEPIVEAAGVNIIREPNLVRLPSPIRDYLAYRDLIRLFRERQYDIVHTHTSKAGYLGRMAAARAGVPIIVHTPHGHVFFGYFTGFGCGIHC